MMEFQMIDETETIHSSKSINNLHESPKQTNIERNNFDSDDDIKPTKLVKAISMQELGPPYKSIVHISSPQDDSFDSSGPRHDLQRSRQAEKNRLILNNTRFANIIEKNRHLELANQKLSAEIKSLEEKQRKTVDSFSLKLDEKLQGALEELKETKKANQSLTLVVDNLKKNVDQLNSELEKSIDLNVHQQRVIASFETKCDNLQTLLNAETSQKNKLQIQIQDMEGEMERLSARLNELINEYEAECLSKVELECKLRGDLEESNFKASVLHTELNEVKSTSAMKFLLIEEKSQKEYDDKLEKFLSVLREEYERKLVENKKEQETLFSMKESDHVWKSQRLDTELQFKSDELKSLESRVESLIIQISKLEGDKVGLEKRLEISQKERRLEKERLEQELRNKEEEAETVRKERAVLLDQYRDLMDTKTALDNELSNYTALLETEEDRLEIHLEKKPPTDGNNNLGKPDIIQ